MGMTEQRDAGVIERWRDWLPVDSATPSLTLGEGGTPLLRAPAVGAAGHRPAPEVREPQSDGELQGPRDGRGRREGPGGRRGRGRVRVDRQHRRVRRGLRGARRAEGADPPARRREHEGEAGAGAHRRRRDPRHPGDVRRRAHGVPRDRRHGSHMVVNSLNPYRIEGQKTAAFELVEELGRAPHVVALPYGGGGNLRSYVKGFAEFGQGEPLMIAGESSERPQTAASAIRITRPRTRRRRRRGGARRPTRTSSRSPTRDRRRVARARAAGGRVLRALLRRRARGAQALRGSARLARRVRADRPRVEGHRRRRTPGRGGQ